MLKAAGVQVRLEPSVTGLPGRSCRSIRNFSRHSKRLVFLLVTPVLWNEKSTGVTRHESDRNTPNDKIFSAPFYIFSVRRPVLRVEPLLILIRLHHVFAKIHPETYASAVKKNNPIKPNMLLGIQAEAQGRRPPLCPGKT